MITNGNGFARFPDSRSLSASMRPFMITNGNGVVAGEISPERAGFNEAVHDHER